MICGNENTNSSVWILLRMTFVGEDYGWYSLSAQLKQPKSNSQSHLQQKSFSAEWQRMTSFVRDEFGWYSLAAQVKKPKSTATKIILLRSVIQQHDREWLFLEMNLADSLSWTKSNSQSHLQQKSFSAEWQRMTSFVRDEFGWYSLSAKSQTAKVICNKSYSQQNDREWLLLLEINLADILFQPKANGQSYLQQKTFSAEWL